MSRDEMFPGLEVLCRPEPVERSETEFDVETGSRLTLGVLCGLRVSGAICDAKIRQAHASIPRLVVSEGRE